MSNVARFRPIEVLLVEDNPADVELTVELLKLAKVRNRLSVVHDGVQALQYLRRDPRHFPNVPTPDLVLLDLNMPKKTGLEVLAEIKKDKDLKQTPVVILTSSGEERDVASSYEVHANCYIQKPVDLEQFAKVVQSIENFWFTVVKLP